MKLHTSLSVVCLLSALSVSAFSQAKSTNKPTGSISGIVTLNGKPLPDIGVIVRRSDSGNPLERLPSTITDERGGYKISNVPAGVFEVQPAAPAYVAADSVGSRSKTLVLAEGENVEGIDFSLQLGGVITGRVKDADGRPSIQQQINLYLADAAQGSEMFAIATATTDDRGIYRMFGLRNGRYKVATGRSESAFSTGLSTVRPSYQQVFYPSVRDAAKAEIVEVSNGSEATGIDITTMAKIYTYAAKGKTVDGKTGLPLPHVRFGLIRLNGERFEPMNEPVASNANGEFIVEGLLAGTYMTFLITEPNGDLRSEAMTFEVLNSDVEHLTVRLTKGASVAGLIALENADPSVAAKLVQMEVRGLVATGAGPFAAGQSAISSVGPNVSFRLAGLSSGIVNLALVDGRDQMKSTGFFIARVERDGVLQPHGVEVKEGQDITGVRLVVGYGSAVVRGVVTLDNGQLPPGGRIVVRLNRVGDSINIRPPRVDTRGHFLIENIPGGSYELTGSVSVSGRTKQTVKRQLILQDGTVNEVTLTIDLQQSNGNAP